MFMGEGNIAERPRQRLCPPDFETVFVEIGRLACEEHYGAWRDTITRWLGECGKERLLARRREFVAWNRKLLSRGRRDRWRRKDERNRFVPISPLTIQQAAHFLRSEGGMTIAQAGRDEWWIGSRRFKSCQMVAFAASIGFDPTTLSGDADLRQMWGRKP